jgi:putative ABC transport system permease protein
MSDPWDLLRFSASALVAHRLRSTLSVVGIAIGIAAVTLLTAIGEGTRRYVMEQFTQFGTNIISIHPGKTETFGIPGVLGGSTHKLTIDDTQALERIPDVQTVVPIAIGQGAVEARGRARNVYVYGVTSDVPEVWRFEVGLGEFLPPGDPRRGASVAVLGAKLARELFLDESPLGKFVRVAGTRLRVIGVMAPRGQLLGMDIDDVAYVPVATGMRMFNVDELHEVHVTYPGEQMGEAIEARVKQVLMARHEGKEDFTITTQAAMLDTFGKIMDMVTGAMGAIGGISLLVGAIGILTMMWISVRERTHEVGLLRAIGATSQQILALFLGEAILLSLLGGLLGLGVGLGISFTARALVPGLPLSTPPEFIVAALLVSVTTGLLAGVLPARRAARLDPIDALRAE